MTQSPLVFHIDVNSAFLSWESVCRLAEDPKALDLRTIPSAVGGDAASRHGIVLAKSTPAKKYGITTENRWSRRYASARAVSFPPGSMSISTIPAS